MAGVTNQSVLQLLTPRPVSETYLDGVLDLSPGVSVVALEHHSLVGALVDALERAGVGQGPVPVDLHLSERLPGAGPDAPDGAYRLEVTPSGVTVTARSRAGLTCGCAALVQLVALADAHAPASGDDAAASPAPRPVIPCAVIEDAPRFPWRGLSLDVARSFFTVEEVAEVLDVLFALRMNVLHLHLTDDQGWRIDIPDISELVDLSGDTAVSGGRSGYYTRADFDRIQAYASRLGITVVPEIDVPGHMNAALHAVPELNPSGEAAAPYAGADAGISRLDAALPATGEFLSDVLDEVAGLAVGDYVHIGGDEPREMDPADYTAILEEAASWVTRAGKRVVAWQEAAAADLPPGTVLQYWDERGGTAAISAAVERGARVLLSPAPHTRLDMKYEPGFELGLDRAGHTDLRDAYEWDPGTALPGVPPEALIGVEAAVSSAKLHSRDSLWLMLLPRLAAVAEVAWSAPEDRDWDDFARRVSAVSQIWSRRGLPWHRSRGVNWPA